MNKTLKFSWWHIIAFLAIIAVSYISFVGMTYLTNGNFDIALIVMGVIDFFYILFFIGAQQLKATGVNMAKKIIVERILIFASPIVFLIGMIPMSHFWTVKSQNDDIVEKFTSSIKNAHQLFLDYEDYSKERISNYEITLTEIINNKTEDDSTFNVAGFVKDKARIQKENMVETLQLQLLSQNFDSLKNVATKWIEKASHGANTWNVFLIGNTKEIKKAIESWETQLKDYSQKELSNEAIKSEIPKFSSSGATNAILGIDDLTKAFTTMKFSIFAIPFGIIIYLMLILPYLFQDRNTKNVNTLCGTNSAKKDESTQDDDYASF